MARHQLCIIIIIIIIDCKTRDHRISKQTKRGNGMVLVCLAYLVLRIMLMLLKQTYSVNKTDLVPTEQFLEYLEKLIFRDRNDVIMFSE